MSEQPDTTGPAESGHLSAVEAAQRAGVNEKTIRRAIASGKLRAPKVHGAFRISPADLRAWQDSLEADTPGPEPDGTPDNLGPVVDELRRLLDEERNRADQTIARKDQKIEELTGEMGYWRGQADVYRSQLAAISAGGDDHHTEDDNTIPGDFTENPHQASPNGPERAGESQGLNTPVGEESPRPAWWRRVLGLP